MKKFNSKWLSLLLIVALLSSFAIGCGNVANDTVSNPKVDQPASVDTVTIEEIADKYFAEMPEHIYKIPEQELKDRVDANDDSILILDIRSPEDYAQGHIKGAVNVPFGKVHEYLDKLPVDKEIIVCCKTGQTAGQTVAILNMYGYNARSLNLGFNSGWVKKNNFPVDTTVNQLPENVNPAKPDTKIAEILKNYFAQMPSNNRIISPADVQAKIEAGEDIQIIDIRKPEDFTKGHVKGAIHISFGEVNKHFDEIAKDKPVYVYCYTGQTAGQTIAVLNTLGIEALSIKGGFKLGWTPENLPVEQ